MNTKNNGDKFEQQRPIVIKKAGKAILFKDGEVIAMLDYDYVDVFYEGLALVIKNGKYGFINETGKEVIPCIYAGAKGFSEGYAAIRDKEETCRWGYIDKNNKPISEFKYYTAYNFHEGIGVVYDGKYFGAIDTNGREIIPCKFNFLGKFENGLAYACVNAKYFYVDIDGNYVCDKLDKPSTRTRSR